MISERADDRKFLLAVQWTSTLEDISIEGYLIFATDHYEEYLWTSPRAPRTTREDHQTTRLIPYASLTALCYYGSLTTIYFTRRTRYDTLELDNSLWIILKPLRNEPVPKKPNELDACYRCTCPKKFPLYFVNVDKNGSQEDNNICTAPPMTQTVIKKLVLICCRQLTVKHSVLPIAKY
ncbi:hypothetical protein Tco_0841309 [Tanacetum coccineum]|uniref:Uncharacterized protein n=1 Tax=Tanacetum coccineum TaxID=301880 RepID=A0ABQ5AYQ8_9ASTR